MLHVFVEGPDDEHFFSKIYGTCFGTSRFIQYAGWPPAKFNNFIRSINCMPDNDYIFLGDADGRAIEEKKEVLTSRFSNLDSNKVFIVEYEIESWDYAGASMLSCQKLKLKQFVYNTDVLTKEQFNAKLPHQADRKYIMAQLLDLYELELATSRNTSLSIFDMSIKKEPA